MKKVFNEIAVSETTTNPVILINPTFSAIEKYLSINVVGTVKIDHSYELKRVLNLYKDQKSQFFVFKTNKIVYEFVKNYEDYDKSNITIFMEA